MVELYRLLTLQRNKQFLSTVSNEIQAYTLDVHFSPSNIMSWVEILQGISTSTVVNVITVLQDFSLIENMARTAVVSTAYV